MTPTTQAAMTDEAAISLVAAFREELKNEAPGLERSIAALRMAEAALREMGSIPERLAAAFKQRGFRAPDTLAEALDTCANTLCEDGAILEQREALRLRERGELLTLISSLREENERYRKAFAEPVAYRTPRGAIYGGRGGPKDTRLYAAPQPEAKEPALCQSKHE